MPPQTNTVDNQDIDYGQCVKCHHIIDIKGRFCLFAIYGGFENCFNWNVTNDCKYFEVNDNI